MHVLVGWALLVAALIAFVTGLWIVAVPALVAGLVVLVRNPETPRYGYSHFVPENDGGETLLADGDSADAAACDAAGSGPDAGDAGSCDGDGGGTSD